MREVERLGVLLERRAEAAATAPDLAVELGVVDPLPKQRRVSGRLILTAFCLVVWDPERHACGMPENFGCVESPCTANQCTSRGSLRKASRASVRAKSSCGTVQSGMPVTSTKRRCRRGTTAAANTGTAALSKKTMGTSRLAVLMPCTKKLALSADQRQNGLNRAPGGGSKLGCSLVSLIPRVLSVGPSV